MLKPSVRELTERYRNSAGRVRFDGLNWYAVANRTLSRMAKESDAPMEFVIAACAMLSPQTAWERNLAQVLELLATGTVVDIPAARLSQAKRALSGESIESICRGLKVRAFYCSILLSGFGDLPCIDSHAINAAMGKRVPESERRKVFNSAKVYNAFADAYREAAALVGVPVQQFQAVVWCAVRGQL